MEFSARLIASFETRKFSNVLMCTDAIASELLYTEIVLQHAAITRTAGSSHSPSFQRHQLLEAHLNTVIHWLDLHFSLPLDQYAGVTFAGWCRLGHTLMLLQRLHALDDPAWDVAAVQSRVDLLALCDRAASILEETGARRRSIGVGVPLDENSAFFQLACIIKAMRNAWDAESNMENQGEGAAIYQALHSHWIGPNLGFDVELMGGSSQGMGATVTPQQLVYMPDDTWLSEHFDVGVMY